MPVLICVLLSVVIISILLYPFAKYRRGVEPYVDESLLIEVELLREQIYEEIRVLHLERDLNKVTEEDYKRVLQQLLLAAANALRNKEHIVQERLNFEATLEKEVQAARRTGVVKGNNNMGNNKDP